MPERRLDDDEEWENTRRFDRGSLRGRRDPLTVRIRQIQGRGQPSPHGTHARYSNKGCRCSMCREAHAAYAREWRTRKMRATWYDTWGRLALAMAQRTRCSRAQIGAVIVSPFERVVATGYNGPPACWSPENGVPPNDEGCDTWCVRGKHGPDAELPPDRRYDDCPSNHAEINALMHSARSDRQDGTIYVTGSVCYACAKAIGNSGLHAVGLVNVDEKADAHRNPKMVRWFLEDCGLEVFDVRVDT